VVEHRLDRKLEKVSERIKAQVRDPKGLIYEDEWFRNRHAKVTPQAEEPTSD
jgi:hypothetical protein